MIELPRHLAQALSAEAQDRKRRNMTWQAVQEEVLTRIHDGQWPEGELIPTEAELATEFGCARATVNRALQTLAQSGVLERRRKVGTRVAQHPRVQMVRFLLKREIEAAGKAYGYALLDYQECAPPADVAQAMLLRTDDSLLRVRARFSADEAPYCCEERWINNYATPGLTREALMQMSPCEWLLGHVPINRASMAIGATLAGSGFIAEALGLAPGDPVLLAERIDWLNNMPVSLTRRYFPQHHRFAATI
ncbi:GntR family transcriptional regulator [Paracoccus sp. APAP_BH8]|uniref:GntR family transcriptional regulator n=1 Tax=Paracoccus pantotrophus TaxID=82367 RepID=A0A7H9BVJ4_PARPN|nr:GntR family transcriptional regulator [Paracoccus pantotrophus]MDF3855975.1 GntR family transcriptional regulator [Paracoccus pantotrophus]QLH15420.1 GntR family transcriptional regulator [Paracoccus pantotrophus]RDD95411.1 GntR family transcriptional regulator [Paracoccus pantotrophus]RNI20540.1 GntR family transcriptional regulator [Paracoccus pantotrophus]WGR65563.1 GntR family transcriptional regulator [Paracoccus pantotrophus]